VDYHLFTSLENFLLRLIRIYQAVKVQSKQKNIWLQVMTTQGRRKHSASCLLYVETKGIMVPENPIMFSRKVLCVILAAERFFFLCLSIDYYGLEFLNIWYLYAFTRFVCICPKYVGYLTLSHCVNYKTFILKKTSNYVHSVQLRWLCSVIASRFSTGNSWFLKFCCK
jgi:hypothetical protein